MTIKFILEIFTGPSPKIEQVHDDNLKFLYVHSWQKNGIIEQEYWDNYEMTKDTEKAKNLTLEKYS